MTHTDPREVLAAIDTFPFEAGTSPFRIKGQGYRGQLSYLDRLPGGRRRVFEALARPTAEAFYGQPFLSSVWYDVVPLIATTAAVAMVHGESFETRTRDRARHQVHEDMKGIQRMIMRLAPAKVVARRVPHSVAQYFDFVDVDAEAAGASSIRFALRRIPTPIDTWLGVVVGTYIEEMVRSGGVASVDVALTRHDDGRTAGVGAHRLHYDVSWSVKAKRAHG